MKSLFVVALLAALAPTARAAMPCDLTDEDMAQLAASPSKLTPESLQTLPNAQKAAVCKSMRTIHSLKEGGKLKTSTDASTSYLGPDYTNIFADALDDYFNALMRRKGIGTKIA